MVIGQKQNNNNITMHVFTRKVYIIELMIKCGLLPLNVDIASLILGWKVVEALS